MATGSGAFPAKAGFNQSGGAYLYVVTDAIATAPAKYLSVFTPGSGSGGATTVGSFASVTVADVPGGVSTLFGVGRLVRDMGKTVVSAGRTFKKIQAVSPTHNGSSPTGGVTGAAATATNPGYATFYVETGYAGANSDGTDAANIAPAPLVRML
jgi:hypothetical protein